MYICVCLYIYIYIHQYRSSQNKRFPKLLFKNNKFILHLPAAREVDQQ